LYVLYDEILVEVQLYVLYVHTVGMQCCGSGSGIRCLLTPGSGIWDPGWVKFKDPNPGSGSGMNNPDHIFESLETIFWVKIIKFFNARDGKNSDPG
jgi:hypothetical protein